MCTLMVFLMEIKANTGFNLPSGLPVTCSAQGGPSSLHRYSFYFLIQPRAVREIAKDNVGVAVTGFYPASSLMGPLRPPRPHMH